METPAFVVCNALALLAAWAVTRALLPSARPFEQLVATVAAMPVVVVATLTILGNLGLLKAWVAGLALLVVSALLLVRQFIRKEPALVTSSEAPLQPSRPTALVAGAIFGLLGLQAVTFFRVQLFTGWRPHWDDLSYHAPMAASWLQAGRLVLAPYHYHAYYPGNGELFAAWFMLPSKLDGYAGLAGAYWMLLGALSVALLCLRLNASIAGAALAVSVLLSCMPFWQQAGTFAAVDLAGAAATAAAIALAAPYSATSDAAPGIRRALLVGGLFGVAIGCKVTFAPLALLTLGYLLLEHRPSLRQGAQTAGAFAASALLCGGFYYARNWWLTGNPLFPAAVLGFEGPMDADARRPTALLYQLRAVDKARLAVAWEELLAWPNSVAYALLLGYAVTLLACLYPRTWKDRAGRLAIALMLLGLLALAVTAAGPFSGTPNAKFARLHIRLRFFLPTALLAAPLLAYWLGRLGRGTPWAIAVGAVAAAWVSDQPWTRVLALAAAGAALMLAWLQLDPERRRHALRPIALAAVLLGPAAAAWTMSYKQAATDEVMRTVIRAWNVVDDEVPDGARVAWFSTFEAYKYYRAFGRRLQFTPVPVGSDGGPVVFLHEYWREFHPTWWREVSTPYELTYLLRNLRKQRVSHVLVMKRHKGPWPDQREVLLRAPGVRAIKKRKSLTLFDLGSRSPRDPA